MEAKLSMWSSYYIDLNPYEMVLELEKNGYEYSELSDEHGLTLLNENDDEVLTGKRFKEYAEKHHVHFMQGHLWLGIRLCSGDETIETLKRWINLFEAIGIKNMVLHCDSFDDDPSHRKEIDDKNIEVLKKLVPFLKGRDIVICLENLFPLFSSADELLYIVNNLSSPNFGICLDTGHLNLSDVNTSQKDFILKANDKLKALHIADNEGQYDQHLMPFGRGNVNFKEVIDCLKKINYQGLFNYEIPGERNCPLEVRAMKLKYIKETYNYLMK